MPRALTWLFLILMASCATPEVEILGQTETFPATAQVEILLDMPSRPHKTFALLQDDFGGTPQEINARLAQKGRDIGADAVVIVKISDKEVTDWIVTNFSTARGGYHAHYRPIKYSYRQVRARAIKYLNK